MEEYTITLGERLSQGVSKLKGYKPGALAAGLTYGYLTDKSNHRYSNLRHNNFRDSITIPVVPLLKELCDLDDILASQKKLEKLSDAILDNFLEDDLVHPDSDEVLTSLGYFNSDDPRSCQRKRRE